MIIIYYVLCTYKEILKAIDTKIYYKLRVKIVCTHSSISLNYLRPYVGYNI